MILDTLAVVVVVLICFYVLHAQGKRCRATLTRYLGVDETETTTPERDSDDDTTTSTQSSSSTSTTSRLRYALGMTAAAAYKLNVSAARKTVPRVDAMPKELREYSFGERLEETGIYAKWSESHEDLGGMCDAVTAGLWYAYHNPNSQDAHHCVAVAENFIEKYANALQARLNKHGQLRGFPWGGNWYQFSISSTSMLAYYLLLPSNEAMRSTAVRLINLLIASPKSSLGWQRDGPNMVYMTGPWLLANHFGGTLVAALESREYKEVLTFLATRFRTNALENGLHPDYSFVAHKSIVAPGYYSNIVSPLTLYLYRLDSQIVSSPERLYSRIKRLIFHDSVPIAPIGFCGRTATMSSRLSETEPDHGVRVMPFARFLRMFTPKLQFAVRGARERLGYYEADKNVFDTAQYWIQYRNVHTTDSSPECVWPSYGLLQRAPKTPSDKRPIALPSRNATTEIYYPTSARSFVMRRDPYGILWQRYRIDELARNVTVTECIVVEYARSITVRASIANDDPTETYHYYGAYASQPVPFDVPPKSRRDYETVFRLDDVSDSVVDVHTVTLNDESLVELPIRLSKDLVVRDVASRYAILYEGDEPRVCAPYELPRESNYLPVKLETGKHAVFRFNRAVNQYTL